MTARRTRARNISATAVRPKETAAWHEGFPADAACRHGMRPAVSVPGNILQLRPVSSTTSPDFLHTGTTDTTENRSITVKPVANTL